MCNPQAQKLLLSDIERVPKQQRTNNMSLEGKSEAIAAAKKRLAAAKAQKASAINMIDSAGQMDKAADEMKQSAQKNKNEAQVVLEKSKKEVQDAEAYLKTTEERFEVVDVDEADTPKKNKHATKKRNGESAGSRASTRNMTNITARSGNVSNGVNGSLCGNEQTACSSSSSWHHRVTETCEQVAGQFHIDPSLCMLLIGNFLTYFTTPCIFDRSLLVGACACFFMAIVFACSYETAPFNRKFVCVRGKGTPGNVFLVVVFFYLVKTFGHGPLDACLHALTSVAWWFVLLMNKERPWLNDEVSLLVCWTLVYVAILPPILQETEVGMVARPDGR